ncbi:DinB family protein [Chlorobium ferrooxidans]|uniref:DinB n=1 Tax=Chlorobium ferrooxidans DSM 13031 TaxID=377431 RepID=Q0YUH6_9CHLB|nr:DinB family protein [Chlorobium ferrooxidans]EAT60055.1 DinB [Chlorobium ferrooxidans DSM 13031]
MDAIAIISELTQHMEWADGVVFSAILGRAQAEGDEVLLKRLRHIHLVQKAFFDVWKNQPVNPHSTDAMNASELAAFAKSLHREIQEFQNTLTQDDLDRIILLPWAGMISRSLGFEVANPTLGQTLMQVTAHSSYHRGQVNSRLRELGIDPPMTDFIAWVWARKPAPSWP